MSCWGKGRNTMPTLLRSGPYRFFFYSGDWNEPLHVHVERDAAPAKFWLEPIRFEESVGFRPGELRRIEAMIEVHHAMFVRSWHEYFGN